MLSKTLLALMIHAKTSQDHTWSGVSKALAEHYHHDLDLEGVMSVMIRSYEEALSEPRFDIMRGDVAAGALLLAPIKGCNSIELGGSKRLDAMFSIEQFYNAMVGRMLSELRLAVVDWSDQFAQAWLAFKQT